MARSPGFNAAVPLLLATALWVGGPAPCRAQAAQLTGTLVMDTVHSPGLEGNLLGDPARQEVAVYLPPGYHEGDRTRYPVLLLLPSFDGDARMWARAWPDLFGPRSGVAIMDSAMAAGTVTPMVVVMPSSRNRYRGHYYVNSEVTGNWEDFLVEDLVAHVDSTYRTRPQPDGWGIAGHSMGGLGAVRVAMRNPGRFAAVYAMSPCCLAGFDDGSHESWERVLSYPDVDALLAAFRKGDFFSMVLMASGAALSPDPDAGPFYARLPWRLEDGALVRDSAVAARWRAATPLALLDGRADALRELQGLRLDHGTRENASLVGGIRRFSGALSERAVPHVYEIYQGTHHSGVMERLATRVLPFFSRTLLSPVPSP